MMTIEELTTNLAALDQQSSALRDEIHANTAKAREINAANMVLIQKKKGVDKDRHEVAHELRKLVDAENKRKTAEASARLQAEADENARKRKAKAAQPAG